MARQALFARLLRIREIRLKAEAADLRARNDALSRVEANLERVRFAAGESIEVARHLHELGALGDLRLAYRRTADEMGRQITENSRQVAHARRLAEAARAACAQIERDREAARERVQETESEHFFGWKKTARQ